MISNGGRMRLLVGAELNEGDVEAIRKGYDLKARVEERLLDHFPDPEDSLLKKRLEVLAWMVAEGTLEIKVVLPRDEFGLPISAEQTRDYYHPKSGIFTDSNGNRIAFSGSVNESAKAWQQNYEEFAVYTSWGEGASYLPQIQLRFIRLWEGKDKDWIALDVPSAITQRLLQFKPPLAPERDPLEGDELPVEEAPEQPQPSTTVRDQFLFQFLRDAPYLPNAWTLGAVTAAITPWPHQIRVADAVIHSYPNRAMFCDEVGLGKTIEAGLVIRQLILSGRVKRCLILAPKSVLRQWQEELYEKFNLLIPRFDGSRFFDLEDQAVPFTKVNPWEAFPIMLAGSQLAKRSDRRNEILQAEGWDLLVVDEAHHARRKDFKEHIYRPNRLLSLLSDIQEAGKATGLLLMTATPMQVHPLEVFDLLQLLGLGGKWGAYEENFLDYFNELRKPFVDTDWEFVFDLLNDHLQAGGELDANFAAQMEAELGPVKWAMLKALPDQSGQRQATIRALGAPARSGIKEMARLHTPLRRFIYRNTRALLREYVKKGILRENVPTRRPRIVRIPMREEEFALYQRIEDYISNFYAKYEAERRGLGFIMTVYRRRLTSSFWAVRCSLERRLKFLKGEITPDGIFTDDDIEQDELSLDITEELNGGVTSDRNRFAVELAYVRDFIQDLKHLSVADSKLERLKNELNTTFKTRSTVLIFTQYTDTMDYLRDQLVIVYGSEVACYSGRGGEIWNGIAWVNASKETVKAEFKSGQIRVLLCTESASEGLNLQSCGVLINYDMPWNPMRVEQRIGRIDRIGQQYKEVWISNYFYQDTIEDVIYQRLSDRIDWFEVVVGDLQPILAEVGEATRRLAMLPAKEREAQLDIEIAALKQRIQNRELESLNLDEFAEAEEYKPAQPSPVTLPQLEELLTRSSLTANLFAPHPEISNAYCLNWKGDTYSVTFSPTCFDEHPDTVKFLSFGSPLLADLLAAVPSPEEVRSNGVARLNTDNGLDVRAWFVEKDGSARSLGSLSELSEWFDQIGQGAPALPDTVLSEAERQFKSQVTELQERQAEAIRQRHATYARAEQAKAHRLLVKAALVELALGQQPTLFDNVTYPSAFNEAVVRGLQRHRYPWSALLQLACGDGDIPTPQESDEYYQQIQGNNRESLKGRFFQLTEEAKKLVRSLNKIKSFKGANQ